MRNLLALIGLALVVFAGVGWYRDWYHIQSRQAEAGHQSVNIDINGTRIIADVEMGIQRIEQKTQQMSQTANKPASSEPPAVEPASNAAPTASVPATASATRTDAP